MKCRLSAAFFSIFKNTLRRACCQEIKCKRSKYSYILGDFIAAIDFDFPKYIIGQVHSSTILLFLSENTLP